LNEWKIAIPFTAIMTAYRDRLSEYEDWLTQKEINTGVYISGE
jgi:hypothetical protein